ncbi:MAG: SbcC/MukB-like Walker B domain-containing protein, partial [Trebonia sp.]
RIAAARRDQQLLLSDSEQRILEDALLTRLAQQIHDRTVDARDLIRAMNREMRSRKMSSGKTVGVSWLLAEVLDDEQRAVCGLLDAGSLRLSPDALARMRAHFATRIKTERARHRDLPYRELLASVLDYRRWRQFAFQLVSPEGDEGRLTRGRHSRLSGGEQSVSLHLPLFAAAHAMLNSANPDAPRLLALDEAFAGVDDTGRGELMSLATQFDLDLFMTGYDLWATSESVRAVAHYDLAHSPVQHTVSALLLVWDGSELIADDTGALTASLGSPGTRRRLVYATAT